MGLFPVLHLRLLGLFPILHLRLLGLILLGLFPVGTLSCFPTLTAGAHSVGTLSCWDSFLFCISDCWDSFCWVSFCWDSFLLCISDCWDSFCWDSFPFFVLTDSCLDSFRSDSFLSPNKGTVGRKTQILSTLVTSSWPPRYPSHGSHYAALCLHYLPTGLQYCPRASGPLAVLEALGQIMQPLGSIMCP